ncbi:MAG: Gfo/Idh/MocA family oxidoreductase [Candidatus Fermentibacteraceae bacterium]|nr:Gfo/Idh/MocA family oxidoreductase [Candidatus Fermentibacteraceae bacterium]MBN2609089.1 Gfo/Idh/MocA family oxidoreductase [Candidatus Fermentibacteraceae bacterium]
MSNFAITGVAGYIAPRHLEAIVGTGNTVVAALDPHDSVGILDSCCPGARFFPEPERFDRHIEKLRRSGEERRVHWMSICSPNYLHDAHIRMAFRIGADAICEKPLVLNPWNLDALEELEDESGCRVWSVLQLRLHPSIIALKERIDGENPGAKYEIDLTYITPRGPWYLSSWKGNTERSGGLATNIGVHFYDMLIWLFGNVVRCEVHVSEPGRCGGFLELERAMVRWFLSIDGEDSPVRGEDQRPRTYRSIRINGWELEFTEGFTGLHTELYRRTLAGCGFGIQDVKPSIQLIHDIRESTPTGTGKNSHAYLLEREHHV